MTRTVNFQELERCWETGQFREYKLCYIDDLARTYWDYTPEAKAYRETEEWKDENRRREDKFHREGQMSFYDPEYSILWNPILKRGSESMDYPNPDYIPGSQTLSAFFTPIPLERQWGDDWDDAPYEHNAGAPYDHDYGEKGDRLEIELLEVLFYLPQNGWDVRFPCDYGGGNSPFCVRDINGGAVAWVYYRGEEGKSDKGAVAIHAGCNPAEFMERIRQIQKAMGPWEQEEDEV